MLVKLQDIKIGNRFRKDLGDIGSLANSIKRQGLLHPIVITEKNELVCGRRRIEAYRKLDYEEIEANLVSFRELNLSSNSNSSSPLDEAETDENIVRKDFTLEEKVEIDERFREREEAAASIRQKRGKRLPSVTVTEGGQSRDRIAKKLGITGPHLDRIRTIKKVSMEHPKELGEVWTKLTEVKTPNVKKAYNKVKQFLRIQEAEQLALKNQNPILNGSNFKLELGPIEELGKKIPDDSIDMIFTDPPYEEKTLYLFDELAMLAIRALKPGGSLVSIIPNGGSEFERVFDKIREFGLKFHHYIPIMHTGGRDRLHKYRIQVDHKPMLWFTKPGPKPPTCYFDIHNVVYSSPPSKNTHEWEQSTDETEYMIKPLTVKGNVILDPFMGSGTTGEAALKLNRKFIGIEVNPIHYASAANRISGLFCPNGGPSYPQK